QPQEERPLDRGGAAPADADRHDRAREGCEIGHDARTVRRDARAARRLLPHRGEGSRRGHDDRREDPVGALRKHRSSAGHEDVAIAASYARATLASAGMSAIADDIARIYRRDGARVRATLIRVLRDFDLAEEVAQEAFAAALEQW